MAIAVIDAFASAGAMLSALRERRFSSKELVELHLQRIERHNPALNAIVVKMPDPREAGNQADQMLARGESRPLLGLPVTLKESMNVRGLPVTAGLPDLANYRSSEDGPIPARVLGAGAVLLGKTNVPPMLSDWQSTNAVYGRTVNPWNHDLTPGGSTGGGAAAVAAGLTALEWGSDIGGSIRVPAAFCGVFGHKPSETALPRSGQFAMPVRPNAGAVMGVQGPLARTAEDLELALDIVAGPDVGEDVAWRLQFPSPRGEQLRDLRVAVLPGIEWLRVSSDVLEALDGLAERLANAGAKVRVTQPEPFGDLRDHHALYLSMLGAMMSSRMPPEERDRQARLVSEHMPDNEWKAPRLAGFRASVADWLGWHARREAYRAAYRAFFTEWDILLAPITLRTAFPHIDVEWPPNKAEMTRTLDVDGKPVPYDYQLVYPGIATLSGQPATAFPIGLSRTGLPIGVQAIGPYLEDRTPIRFAALATCDAGGFVPPPGYRDD